MNNMPFCLFFFYFFLLFTGSSGGPANELGASECSDAPPAGMFLRNLKNTVSLLPVVTSALSGFAGAADAADLRHSAAVSDCVRLMEFSGEVLQWCLSAACTGKHNIGTGDRSADLRTWITAATTSMHTCMDGLEDGRTPPADVEAVSGHIRRVTALLRDLLDSVSETAGPSSCGGPEPVRAAVTFTANVTVAADGTGDFTTVAEAVEAAPEKSLHRFVIRVKSGVYREYVEINEKKWNLVLLGDGADVTTITGNRSRVDGWKTFVSATVTVMARGFMAQDLTFENTAGPAKEQAVALRSDSDLAVFYRCGMRGFQDTLYVHSMRQFFRECEISGTVDFIFGDGTVVFQSCHVISRMGLPGQLSTVTAQGRDNATATTGFSLQFCNFTAEHDLPPAAAYLGRPWRLYSRTVVMQSYLSDAISPEGWLKWNQTFALDTLFYGEYKNFGPGMHVITETEEACEYTVARFIIGDSWLPATGVEYTSGL